MIEKVAKAERIIKLNKDIRIITKYLDDLRNLKKERYIVRIENIGNSSGVDRVMGFSSNSRDETYSHFDEPTLCELVRSTTAKFIAQQLQDKESELRKYHVEEER